jgi:glycosyltransferase involved in cell wall biosynthesis
MDLVAEMLLQNLQRHQSAVLRAVRIRPRFIRRLSRFRDSSGVALNGDRLLNRVFDYPRYLRRIRDVFDIFHVVDHSYGHLLLELPSRRAAITCHDLMTFRCLLEPKLEPRSRAFRWMTRRILNGLGRAGRIACDSRATRAELLRYGLAHSENTVVIPNGVAPMFTSASDQAADDEANRLLGPTSDCVELLNVAVRCLVNVLICCFACSLP